jgi:hypothetical protein
MLIQRVEVLHRYVHVVCSGTMDLEDFAAGLDLGLESAARSGRRVVVMDALNVQGLLSTLQRFVLGNDIAHIQKTHRFVAAILVVANEPPLEVGRFAERVAISLGAVGKSFTDLADAERWIEDYLATFPDSDSGGNR